MRKGLVMLHPEHTLGPSPSLSKLIVQCQQAGKITQDEAEKLEKLRDVTFYAESGLLVIVEA